MARGPRSTPTDFPPGSDHARGVQAGVITTTAAGGAAWAIAAAHGRAQRRIAQPRESSACCHAQSPQRDLSGNYADFQTENAITVNTGNSRAHSATLVRMIMPPPRRCAAGPGSPAPSYAYGPGFYDPYYYPIMLGYPYYGSDRRCSSARLGFGRGSAASGKKKYPSAAGNAGKQDTLLYRRFLLVVPSRPTNLPLQSELEVDEGDRCVDGAEDLDAKQHQGQRQGKDRYGP